MASTGKVNGSGMNDSRLATINDFFRENKLGGDDSLKQNQAVKQAPSTKGSAEANNDPRKSIEGYVRDLLSAESKQDASMFNMPPGEKVNYVT